MGRRPKGERVLGPYAVRGGWQCVLAGPGGVREYFFFPTEERARRWAAEAERQLVRAAATIDEAIDEYEKHLIEKGDKRVSYRETTRRLRLFCTGELDSELGGIPPGWGARRYLWLRGGTAADPGYVPKTGRPLSTDTHRNILAEARSFFSWLVARRWLSTNPLDGVEGVGRRRHGKTQLRIDEARRWMRHALALARGGEPGAVAALLTLLMGLRASEVVSRAVRDVDDDGRLLWIPDAKTPAGRRTVPVPAPLRTLLRRLARGREGAELLFPAARGVTGKHWRDWPREWVQRICDECGVLKVTAHGMRGLFATLGDLGGTDLDTVARLLGHEDRSTTEQSYADRESVQARRQERAFKVLDGGKRR